MIGGVAVYHFTFHAFGTWRADHPRGYTVREEGYQPPDAQEQRRRDEHLTQDVVHFDEDMQKVLVVGTYDICRRRGWQFFGGGNDATHTHALIGFKQFVDWQDARDTLKNILSLFLGRWTGREGVTWFVEGGSRKRVENRGHFEYLLDRYFPDHRGVYWRAGRPLPQIPTWFLHGKNPRDDKDKGDETGASATGYQMDREDELYCDNDYAIDHLIDRFLREDEQNDHS